ncbi:WGR domain-containing protein [Calothrix sp. NIES-4071]|nr:WGR domain-containing protein [Calothrix sp. NIES-4071]BAZ54569.1 WGR domain-containing protein [Calothrix sp. NIES-4105]
MKLVKRTTLHYREGTSDKVYEVDICQTGKAQYVVNFRYGKRGATLKEGVKTTQAVPLPEAERVFDKLVQEKTKKGYQDVSSPLPTIPAQTAKTSQTREEAILTRLANTQPSKWKLERVIWRAGELKIKEAAPLLINLIGTGEPLRDYCIAWSLGYCGSQEAIPVLIQLYQNASSPEFVSRIAFEALLQLSDVRTKAELQAEMIEFLPKNLQKLARDGSTERFASELSHYLKHEDYKSFTVLDKIYQIDNNHVRPVLLEILRTAPYQPNYFKYLRHIFKMAEYRYDAEVYGIFAYRFKKESGTFDNYWQWNSKKRRHEDELKSLTSTKAYSNQTQAYLQRRIWRTLKQLGEDGADKYVNMAASVLLQYSDADAEPVRETTFYRWNRSNWHRVAFNNTWDAYASCITFNHILYSNSARYELKTNSKAWKCKPGYKPGTPEAKREEAFPQLWEQQPQVLLRLLLASECHPVHEFAVKALRTCTSFYTSINIDKIIQLLQKPYEVTAQFGGELAQSKYNPHEPNIELVLAVINSISQTARNLAYQWIESNHEFFLQNTNFITALILNPDNNTRNFAKKLLSTTILNDITARVLLGRIIIELLAFTPNAPAEIIKEISEILLISFAPQLRTLGINVINDLLTHPILEIQELGARILLNHQIGAENLPADIIESLLASPYETLRVIGIRLFGQLSDTQLLKDSTLIIGMAISANSEIRNAIKPIIHRLGAAHPDFKLEIAHELIEILLIPEQHQGVHSFLLHLLQEMPQWMTSISKHTALSLLQTKSSAAQELGGLILQANLSTWVSEFTSSEIVKLANHEIIAVRQAAQQMLLQSIEKLRNNPQELITAVKTLEAKWQDTRDFAFNIFTTQFGAKDFTPQVLISICDSVREETRKFGRDLLTQNFQTQDAEQYLLKFSEHPSSDMQTLVTNYLENYATDNPQHLQQLAPYFTTVLSNINRSRTAKQRIFQFLKTESQKSEQAAQIVADIMTRQSLTIAIQDKATTLQIMLTIHKKYPHINLPIHTKT